MRQQQDRLARAGAAQPRHQVALARRGREHLHVAVGKARRAKPRRHRFGRLRGVAGRGHGVDLDQFLVDVVGELLLRGQSFGAQRRGTAAIKRRDKRRRKAAPNEAAKTVVLRIFALPYLLLSLTAITSISTRKPGLASAATPTDRTRRQIRLAAAEELGVALHEAFEIHRRGGVVHQEDLHLHHVAHGEPKAFENGLDPVQHADRLDFGVAIGLQARGIGVLVDHRRHLTADVIGRDVASDLDRLCDREGRVRDRMPHDLGPRRRACRQQRSKHEDDLFFHKPLPFRLAAHLLDVGCGHRVGEVIAEMRPHIIHDLGDLTIGHHLAEWRHAALTVDDKIDRIAAGFEISCCGPATDRCRRLWRPRLAACGSPDTAIGRLIRRWFAGISVPPRTWAGRWLRSCCFAPGHCGQQPLPER